MCKPEIESKCTNPEFVIFFRFSAEIKLRFPVIKALAIEDKSEIQRLVKSADLAPYSDFFFVNMWIWDTSNTVSLSELNGNLVIVFSDYVSKKPFISFIGKNKIKETAQVLLDFSKKQYGVDFLKLIPEEIAHALSKQGFNIKADDDSQDYIYAIDHLVDMDKWGNTKSKNIRKFAERHPDYSVRQVSLQDDKVIDELKNLFKTWSNNKHVSDHSDLNEYKALEKLLALKDPNVGAVLFYVGTILAGFTVYELVPEKHYAISRFAKGDTGYDSAIYDVLNWEEAKALKVLGVMFYNWEQDLGIEGLRYSKEKYQPALVLKKFIVNNLNV